MINEFLKSKVGVIIISIIWGLGLATLFKKSCDSGSNCKVIEYRGPTTEESQGVWRNGDNQCYRLKPYLVDCKSRLLKAQNK